MLNSGTLKSSLMLLCLFFIIMADGYDMQSIGFVAPEIARNWGLSLAALGPAFAAALAGAIPGAMMAGPVAKHMGRRPLLAAALLLFGGGTIGCVYADSITVLAAIRFFVGLGLGAAIPLVMSIAAQNVPDRWRATLITVVLCGQPIGAIAGAALCARLIPAYGWQSAFWLGGLVPLLLMLTVFLLPASPPAANTRASALHPAGGASSPRLFSPKLQATTWLLSATAFFAVFLLYVVVNWLPGTMRASGHSLQDSLLAISLFNFGGIAGAVIVGMLVDRIGPFKVVAPAYLLAAVALAGLAGAQNDLPLLLLAALISGLAAYGCGVCLGSLTILLYPPSLHASSAGWVLGVGRVGAALGPVGIAFALSLGLIPGQTFYFASAAAVLAAACLLALATVSAQGQSS